MRLFCSPDRPRVDDGRGRARTSDCDDIVTDRVLHVGAGVHLDDLAFDVQCLLDGGQRESARLSRGLERLRAVLPAGLATGLFAWLSPTRGLAGVRARVLEQSCLLRRQDHIDHRLLRPAHRNAIPSPLSHGADAERVAHVPRLPSRCRLLHQQ